MAKGAYIGVPTDMGPPKTLGSMAIGDTIKLKENGSPAEYIVVHQGIPSESEYDASCNGTWLLRKDVYINSVWATDMAGHDYSNSVVHEYLNDDFLSVLESGIQTTIKEINLPCAKVNRTKFNLSTKIFVLSHEEIGADTGSTIYSTEGAKLDYFISGANNADANAKRVAYLNGATVFWWTRSRAIQGSNFPGVVCVQPTGQLPMWKDDSSKYGIRPALIMPATCTVGDDGLVTGEMVEALGGISVGSTVKLNENGSPVEYLVVHQGNPDPAMYDSSCNGTWLLRKDIYEKRAWDSTNHDYANSDIHAYLNGDFLEVYDTALLEAIKQVKIPYRAGVGSSTTITSGANGLSAKVFLLSSTEVHFTNANIPANEGAVLDYCSDFTDTGADTRRIAYIDGTTSGWWLRSPYTTSNTYVSAVFASGSCGNNGCSTAYGVRPAMIMPPNIKITPDGLVTGETTSFSTMKDVARKIKKGYIGISGIARKIKKAYIGIGGGVIYREVECIQSSGTQYIDTGFVPNQDTRVVMDCEVTNFPENWAALFSTRSDSETTNAFAFYYKDAGNVYDQYGSQNVNLANQTVTGRRIVDKNKNIATVDGTVINTFAYTAFTAQCSLCLFMDRMPTKAAKYFFSGKTYSCQIYDNDTLIRDYVPVINPNGTAGLFDKVSKHFFANAGTGNFTAGAETGATHTSVGVARPCWSGGELVYYGTVTALSVAREYVSGASTEKHALFAGGINNSGTRYNTVDAYDSKLTRTNSATLSAAIRCMSSTRLGGNAVFGGGDVSSGVTNIVNKFDLSLSRTSSTLSFSTSELAAATIGERAIFAGGTNQVGGEIYDTVNAFDASLTRTTPTSLSQRRYGLRAASNGKYALFGGGAYGSSAGSNVVDAYDASLTRSNPSTLITGVMTCGAAPAGGYVLFGGGYTDGNAVDTVTAYDTSLTRSAPSVLNAKVSEMGATSVANYALFGGGAGLATSVTNSVTAYDEKLTRTAPTLLSSARYSLGATAIGDYALFGGGVFRNMLGTRTIQDAVDAYAVV